ncbi:hypothetical protein HK405_014403 [Cladochytrium tenue]|nr:hypothetical protein HK405_014403 [Cladochytrium tenue]
MPCGTLFSSSPLSSCPASPSSPLSATCSPSLTATTASAAAAIGPVRATCRRRPYPARSPQAHEPQLPFRKRQRPVLALDPASLSGSPPPHQKTVSPPFPTVPQASPSSSRRRRRSVRLAQLRERLDAVRPRPLLNTQTDDDDDGDGDDGYDNDDDDDALPDASAAMLRHLAKLSPALSAPAAAAAADAPARPSPIPAIPIFAADPTTTEDTGAATSGSESPLSDGELLLLE